MKNNIISVEDWLNELPLQTLTDDLKETIIEKFNNEKIEFAKLHCKKQLEAILENAKTKNEYWEGLDDGVEVNIIDRDSILNAYNLDNIK